MNVNITTYEGLIDLTESSGEQWLDIVEQHRLPGWFAAQDIRERFEAAEAADADLQPLVDEQTALERRLLLAHRDTPVVVEGRSRHLADCHVYELAT